MKPTSGAFLVACLCLLACGRGGRDDGIPELRLIEPPLLAREIDVPRAYSSEPDDMGFALAGGLAFHADQVVVLEGGNNRLVVFNQQREPVAYFGREGAGPGEIRGAIDLASWKDEYAVAEIANTRVSVFAADGRFLRSFAVPNGFTDIAYGPDGTIYVNAYDGRNYLLAVDREGRLRPFGERPWDLYPAEFLDRPAGQAGERFFLAVTDSATVFVYDHILAALVAMDSAGRRIGLYRLPGKTAAALVQQSALVRRDFGGDGRGATAGITDLSITDAGLVFIVFPNVGAIALLVNPADSTAREVRWGPGLDPKFGGFAGLVRRDTFYRISSDALRLFRLAPQ